MKTKEKFKLKNVSLEARKHYLEKMEFLNGLRCLLIPSVTSAETTSVF